LLALSERSESKGHSERNEESQFVILARRQRESGFSQISNLKFQILSLSRHIRN
jgi:hypothetical protein